MRPNWTTWLKDKVWLLLALVALLLLAKHC